MHAIITTVMKKPVKKKGTKQRRIPVPQKPPKVERNKKSYDRKSEKKRTRKNLEEET